MNPAGLKTHSAATRVEGKGAAYPLRVVAELGNQSRHVIPSLQLVKWACSRDGKRRN